MRLVDGLAVEEGVGVGVGETVGEMLAVGVGVRLGLGVGVGVTVGQALAVGVGVLLGMALGVAVRLARGVLLGVAEAAAVPDAVQEPVLPLTSPELVQPGTTLPVHAITSTLLPVEPKDMLPLCTQIPAVRRSTPMDLMAALFEVTATVMPPG